MLNLTPFSKKKHRFQEIVPLNAGNVLGTEDNGPAKKWVALIRRTLNSLPRTSSELNSDFEGSKTEKNPSFLNGPSSCSMRIMKSEMGNPQPRLTRGYSVNGYDPNLGSLDDDNDPDSIHSHLPYCGGNSSYYCLVASKQMVGIYLTVWVKNDLRDDVRNMKVSCVGRGLMGYLGNKVKNLYCVWRVLDRVSRIRNKPKDMNALLILT